MILSQLWTCWFSIPLLHPGVKPTICPMSWLMEFKVFFFVMLCQHSISSQQTLVYWQNYQSGKAGRLFCCIVQPPSEDEKQLTPMGLPSSSTALAFALYVPLAHRDPAFSPSQRLDVLQTMEALCFHVSKNLI